MHIQELGHQVYPALSSRIAYWFKKKKMKFLVSCVTYDPKLRPTIQCHVGSYFLSNSFLMNPAISFSVEYFSIATEAVSIASCCISSAIQKAKSKKKMNIIFEIQYGPNFHRLAPNVGWF